MPITLTVKGLSCSETKWKQIKPLYFTFFFFILENYDSFIGGLCKHIDIEKVEQNHIMPYTYKVADIHSIIYYYY
jgi:hypothetical protein